MIRATPESDDDSLMPDLTPLLDIIFILLVFLLLSANIQIHTLDLDIPSTTETNVLASQQKEAITLGLHHEGENWALNGARFADWDAFRDAVLAAHRAAPKKEVVIAADKNANVENMLKLLSFLQKNNINNTNIVMEQE